MKKFLVALLCAVLCLAFSAACADTYTVAQVGSFDFPSDYQYESAAEDPDEDDPEWVFSGYNDKTEFDFYLIADGGTTGDNLFQYSADELGSYITSVTGTDSEGTTYEYVETVNVPVGQTEIPFIILKMVDDEGEESYTVETVANGTTLLGIMYYIENSPVDAALLDSLKSVVSGFVPAA